MTPASRNPNLNQMECKVAGLTVKMKSLMYRSESRCTSEKYVVPHRLVEALPVDMLDKVAGQLV